MEESQSIWKEMLIAKLGNWLITRALIEPCTYWLEPPFFTIKGHAISHNVDRKGGTHRQNTHTRQSQRERHAPFWPENLGVRREHVRSAAGDVGHSASASGEEARGEGDDRRSMYSAIAMGIAY